MSRPDASRPDTGRLAGRTVVAFGTYRTDLHPRVAVLVEGLRRHGAQVVELNEPLPLDTAAKVRILRRPWLLPVLAWSVTRCWVRLARRARSLRRAGTRVDAVLVGYLGHFDVHLARLLLRRVPLVLDHLVFARDTAVDRGTTSPVVLAALGVLDRAAVARADVVVLDTDEHVGLLPAAARARAVVVPVGATDAWFAADAHEPPGDGPLRVVFAGLFTPLQGATTVAGAARLLADRSPGAVAVTMVGRGQDLAEARRVAGAEAVEWTDWVESARLPALVASHDVALGVFGTTPKAARVVPTKVYQGAAAGRAVVTSRTPPQERALGEAGLLVPAGDAEALAEALLRLAGDRSALAAAQQAARELAARSFSTEAAVSPLVDALLPRLGPR